MRPRHIDARLIGRPTDEPAEGFVGGDTPEDELQTFLGRAEALVQIMRF